jgi:hypothetical protein
MACAVLIHASSLYQKTHLELRHAANHTFLDPLDHTTHVHVCCENDDEQENLHALCDESRRVDWIRVDGQMKNFFVS